jgi:hypothetical protein
MIPPLRLPPKDFAVLPRPTNPQPWERISKPTYWFGDRVRTNLGWGICSGVKRISTGDWLYYIDLDDTFCEHPFAESEIKEKLK